MFITSTKGATASAEAYSIAESAKANGLKPYKYFEYLLAELPSRKDKDGNIDPTTLDDLMPWSKRSSRGVLPSPLKNAAFLTAQAHDLTFTMRFAGLILQDNILEWRTVVR